MSEFTVQCPLCSTDQNVTDDLIGKAIRCPDCHTRFTVREPGKKRRPARPPSEDDELQLSPVVERPPPTVPTFTGGESTPEPTDEPDDDEPNASRAVPDPRREYSTPAEEALRNAEEDDSEFRDATPVLPPSPFLNGLGGFIFEPTLFARWIFLSILAQLLIIVLGNAVYLSVGTNAADQFIGMLLTIASVVLGSFFAISAAVTALTILRDTAHGEARVTDWPAFDAVDWFLDSLNLLVCLAAAFIIGATAGQPFAIGGPVIYLFGVLATCSLSLLLLFPPLLLSVLEGGSPIAFGTASIWKSFRFASSTWLQFFGLSLGLLLIAAAAWQLRRFEFLITSFVACMVATLMVFIFFRMMGRLYWACQVKLLSAEEPLDEFDDDDE